MFSGSTGPTDEIKIAAHALYELREVHLKTNKLELAAPQPAAVDRGSLWPLEISPGDTKRKGKAKRATAVAESRRKQQREQSTIVEQVTNAVVDNDPNIKPIEKETREARPVETFESAEVSTTTTPLHVVLPAVPQNDDKRILEQSESSMSITLPTADVAGGDGGGAVSTDANTTDKNSNKATKSKKALKRKDSKKSIDPATDTKAVHCKLNQSIMT